MLIRPKTKTKKMMYIILCQPRLSFSLVVVIQRQNTNKHALLNPQHTPVRVSLWVRRSLRH